MQNPGLVQTQSVMNRDFALCLRRIIIISLVLVLSLLFHHRVTASRMVSPLIDMMFQIEVDAFIVFFWNSVTQ